VGFWLDDVRRSNIVCRKLTLNFVCLKNIVDCHASSRRHTQATTLWWYSEAKGLERGTLAQYRQLKSLHIDPFNRTEEIDWLTVARVRSFEDKLREAGRSPSMIKKVLVALGSILADAREGGSVGRNVARDVRARRSRGTERRQERRHKGRLRVGVDILRPERRSRPL
jgi:integrase